RPRARALGRRDPVDPALRPAPARHHVHRAVRAPRHVRDRHRASRRERLPLAAEAGAVRREPHREDATVGPVRREQHVAPRRREAAARPVPHAGRRRRVRVAGGRQAVAVPLRPR
ncbi:MAG: hypothetical protein ACK559_22255, partial [bacterium]